MLRILGKLVGGTEYCRKGERAMGVLDYAAVVSTIEHGV